MASSYSSLSQDANTEKSEIAEPLLSGRHGSLISTEETIPEDFNCYLPLQKAILNGNWTNAKNFFECDPHAVTAKITFGLETALHIAVGTGKNLEFLKELLNLMLRKDLEQRDKDGDTALAYAAMVGNIKAAKMLVSKNPDLIQVKNSKGMTPLHQSAQYGHKETLLYLLDVTREDRDPYPFRGKLGVRLLNYVIVAGFYDVALDLVKCYPHLAIGKDESNEGPLDKLAEMPSPCASWNRLPFWRRFIYACMWVSLVLFHILPSTHETMIENLRCVPNIAYIALGYYQRKRYAKTFLLVCIALASKLVFLDLVLMTAPSLNQIHHTKLMRQHFCPLLQCIFAEVVSLKTPEARKLLPSPILKAAEIGTHEIITECAKYYPSSIWFSNNGTIFHRAVLNRHVKVFNLIYQMGTFKHVITTVEDMSSNNLLHLAAKLAPSSELNRVSGAALQMQCELQWYKEVENLLQPSYKEMTNCENKTPKTIFSDEHKDLIKEGEKWMKDTATSCMIVATLIATVMFTAVFTVPGGNRGDEGIPIFLNAEAFMVFAISDALALFSSLTSVLMFLSILTSRYAEEDFLYSLPTKLIIGLTTLFISIASMMIAFGATLFIVLSRKIAWIAIPVSLLACVPVILYGSLQFRLLVTVVRSTYGPSMFKKKHKWLFAPAKLDHTRHGPSCF